MMILLQQMNLKIRKVIFKIQRAHHTLKLCVKNANQPVILRLTVQKAKKGIF